MIIGGPFAKVVCNVVAAVVYGRVFVVDDDDTLVFGFEENVAILCLQDRGGMLRSTRMNVEHGRE